MLYELFPIHDGLLCDYGDDLGSLRSLDHQQIDHK
jgi:hypothetical protein